MKQSFRLDRLEELTAFLSPVLGAARGSLQIEARGLRGGLDSAGVAELTLRFEAAPGRRCSRRLVLKRLCGQQVREARVYEEILGVAQTRLAPPLAGVRRHNEECWLLLERVRRVSSWPWPGRGMPERVLCALAELHTAPQPQLTDLQWLAQWDYEAELAAQSRVLAAALPRLPAGPDWSRLRAAAGAVRRLSASLPQWRKWLLDLPPFGRTFIHGDVHPGNVMIRKDRGDAAAVLVDWGRSRIGSPLEDVSSWLQSLGFWESSTRQRHDTLLLTYLEARGFPRRLGRELRDAYWLAAASNLLGGAILYHLTVLQDPASSEARRKAALAAAADGLRVMRRADACWRSRVK